MYAKIKNALGRKLPRQRYSDTEDAQTPDQQIDPEEWHHDADPGLGERLKRSKRTLLTYGLGIAVAIGIAIFYSRQFVIDIASNPAVQTVASHGGVLLLGFILGVRSFKARVRDWDWLILQFEDGTLPLLGELQQADDGTMVFTPYAGIDWLGFRSRQLTLGELGSSVARNLAKRGRDMDSGARIRVDDAIAATQETAFGNVTSVLTSKLEVDPFGTHSDVYTAPPNTVDAEAYQDLRDRLEDFVEDEIPRLRAKVRYTEQQVEELRSRLQQSGDEAIDQFIARYARIEEAREQVEEPSDDRDTGGDILSDFEDDETVLANGGGSP